MAGIDSEGAKVMSNLIRNYEGPLTSLDLNNNYLMDKGVVSIMEAIMEGNNSGKGGITDLNLGLNHMTTNMGVAAIANALRGANSSLQKLDLSNNDIKAEGVKMITDAIIERKMFPGGLKELYLTNANIGAKGAQFLANIISQPDSSLTLLNLDHNQFGPVGGMAIAEALRSANNNNNNNNTHFSNQGLVELSINRNYIGGEASAIIMAEMFSGKSPTLKMVHLNFNRIGDAGFNLFANMLQNAPEGLFLNETWQKRNSSFNSLALHLNDNQITEVSFVPLAYFFMKNLSTLDVSSNSIKDAGALALADVLLKEEQLSIKNLNVADVNMTSAGAVAIAKALQNGKSSLVTLNLSSNNIRDEGFFALADALISGKTFLKELDLSNNFYSQKGLFATKQAFLLPNFKLKTFILGKSRLLNAKDNEKALAYMAKASEQKRAVTTSKTTSFFGSVEDPSNLPYEGSDVIKLIKDRTRRVLLVEHLESFNRKK